MAKNIYFLAILNQGFHMTSIFVPHVFHSSLPYLCSQIKHRISNQSELQLQMALSLVLALTLPPFSIILPRFINHNPRLPIYDLYFM